MIFNDETLLSIESKTIEPEYLDKLDYEVIDLRE